jgi:D-alanyl-D-alanine carboxypeptidase/D-alanyl-D-alanine-endopeptidase (penicillin-binding protein 4)
LLSAILMLTGFGQLKAQMDAVQHKTITKAWNDLGMANNHHVGLSIYNLRDKKSFFNYRADNFFTPASNTKILTMYAALEMLDEQLDAAFYVSQGDSLIIWGGGDPGTFFPAIDSPAVLPAFIRSSAKNIVFSDSHFLTTRFGKGWAWDDYPFTYQCERNAFPIYGNRLWVTRSGDSLTVTPAYLSTLLKVAKDSVNTTGKSEWGEGYVYTYSAEKKTDEIEIPITFFKNDLQYCWREATGKSIQFQDLPFPKEYMAIKGSNRDTLIKIMLHDSDNFIAEQLLLACSMKALHYMDEEAIIDSLLRGSLDVLEDDIDWVDGSGLSRYNLMTPRSVISVLLESLRLKDMAYMKDVFPAGGQTGTIQNGFKGKNGKPYIYAKSGSLKNVYCLSGFLLTKSGNILLFSWMNNQFEGRSTEVKASMEKFFSFLYEQY